MLQRTARLNPLVYSFLTGTLAAEFRGLTIRYQLLWARETAV
ncbi:hypothetical protein MELA_00038 [Candidatus Methylomirabilis lanthanidiphila]|uniref:Uncharacterized protein n=1 Tax=Candidatus Methylomirabilis lanthanidiphila TaxID=2211376 RepID=A0A564ZED7_9BACT|nr:hypothetical protein MELA_00038 [Candidatus Methylomirabilis lanthanidiphila]